MFKLKVCGIKDEQNYNQLLRYSPDFIGLNFYPGSPRYIAGNRFIRSPNSALVGIFVDEEIVRLIECSDSYKIDYIQLHGHEPAQYCKELHRNGFRIIKAFNVNDCFDFDSLVDYLPTCDYFLFDAAGESSGGNGTAFNWEVLNYYPFRKPFFVAGGISLKNIDGVLEIKCPQLFGIDVNSAFETSPGIKDILKIQKLKQKLDAANVN